MQATTTHQVLQVVADMSVAINKTFQPVVDTYQLPVASPCNLVSVNLVWWLNLPQGSSKCI